MALLAISPRMFGRFSKITFALNVFIFLSFISGCKNHESDNEDSDSTYSRSSLSDSGNTDGKRCDSNLISRYNEIMRSQAAFKTLNETLVVTNGNLEIAEKLDAKISGHLLLLQNFLRDFPNANCRAKVESSSSTVYILAKDISSHLEKFQEGSTVFRVNLKKIKDDIATKMADYCSDDVINAYKKVLFPIVLLRKFTEQTVSNGSKVEQVRPGSSLSIKLNQLINDAKLNGKEFLKNYANIDCAAEKKLSNGKTEKMRINKASVGSLIEEAMQISSKINPTI